MSYIALARKYRPNNFSELVGQDVLISTFHNAILNDRIHHAFLLTGIRGIGKTTTARIIAKNLNCEKGYTMEPCDVCANCTSIKNGSHPDVIEFDAASNTSIEDIKVIISNTHYAPTLARKKVFIIDEIHMLSTKAFNALLKTLEEPPENIVFIFATTESRKVPITILSRCQKFFLKALSVEEIALQLEKIAQKEGFSFEREALITIAGKAGGSMRDGISILDQAILNAKQGNVISFADVREMLKMPTEDEIKALFENILNGEAEKSLIILNDLTKAGIEEIEIVNDIIELVAQKIKNEACSKKEFGLPNLMRFYQILQKGFDEVKFTENKKVALEVLIVKLLFAWKLPSPIEIIERLKSGEANDILKIFESAKIVE
jgi:DNA polymerase-3 subunit gamma/tau